MQRNRTARRTLDRHTFNQNLSAYSGLSAVVAVTAAVGATAEVHGQAIIPLRADDFSSTLSFSIPSLNGTGYTSTSGIFSIGPVNNASIHVSVFQSNYSGHSDGLTYRGAHGKVKVYGAPTFRGISISGSVIKKLGNGDPVKTSPFFGGTRLFGTSNYASGIDPAFPVGHKTSGDFALNVPGYMGFRVRAADSSHYYYGWLRMEVTGDGQNRPTGFQLVASEDGVYGAYILDGPIAAGQLSAVPEPATVAAGLGLFALGAAGVREFRKRRRAA